VRCGPLARDPQINADFGDHRAVSAHPQITQIHADWRVGALRQPPNGGFRDRAGERLRARLSKRPPNVLRPSRVQPGASIVIVATVGICGDLRESADGLR
jgi:hypothetical protein